MTREGRILIESRDIVAEPSLVLLKTNIDRTSDLFRKVYFVHLGCYREIVVGRFEPPLCDDHYGAQG